MESNVAVPQRGKYRIIIWPTKSGSTDLKELNFKNQIYRSERITTELKAGRNRYLYTSAYDLIHNSQKVETPKCPSRDEWINKMWPIQTVVYHSIRSKRKIDIWCNMAGSWKHYAKWSKPEAGCFSPVRLFVTLWTVARQAPLSMGFSRQEHWSGLPCPPPRDLSQPMGSNWVYDVYLYWQVGSSPLMPPGKLQILYIST